MPIDKKAELKENIQIMEDFFKQFGFSVAWSYTQNVHKLFKVFWYTRDVNISLTPPTIRKFLSNPGAFLEMLEEKYDIGPIIGLATRNIESGTWSPTTLSEITITDKVKVLYSTPSMNNVWNGIDPTNIFADENVQGCHINMCFRLGMYDELIFRTFLGWSYCCDTYRSYVSITDKILKKIQDLARSLPQGEGRMYACHLFTRRWRALEKS